MVGVSRKGVKNSKSVREFKSSGNKAMHAGAFQKAMRLYTRALDLDPGNAILYSNRSAAHFNLRQFAESLEDAESAILCDATWWKAYKRKGLALIHMQRYEEAIRALEEGLEIVKKNAEMEKNLEFAKACHEQAQNLYILPEQPMMQKLESVPVFIVTDNVGQPFFVTYDDGQQVCTFYFDQEDANATLDWIKSENPGLGDTARVIHITLNQAFNLAQETQKQYYEETTRAAAEEDRLAAAAAKEGKVSEAKVITDVDGDDDDSDDNMGSPDDVNSTEANEGSTSTDTPASAASDANPSSVEDPKESPKLETDVGDSKPSETITDDGANGKNEDNDGDTKTEDGEKEDEKDEAKDGEKKSEKPEDDGIIDENAPLSFQFRPELRQVKIAVELLNKHPNPPVKPILRDPPSVRKAKAEAAAAAAKEVSKNAEKEDSSPADESKKEEVGQTKEVVKAEEGGDVTSPATDAQEGENAVPAGEGDNEEGKEDCSDVAKTDITQGDDEVLTVDNFNGIPIFQAKGLTLLQKDKQLIPLFFSKWDLEEAWKQLKQSNAIDIPGECDIDVGTLEDVLRRMSECKTDEFKNVFFVPSRESMKAINAKFPLDELAATNHAAARLRSRPMVKKATFSKAKQIAARGGSKDEIRAAIREDLEKVAERQRMADIIAQLENVGRSRGMNLSRMAASTGAGSSSSSKPKGSADGNTAKATSVS